MPFRTQVPYDISRLRPPENKIMLYDKYFDAVSDTLLSTQTTVGTV